MESESNGSFVSPGQAKLIGEYLRSLRERGGKDGYFRRRMSLHDLATASQVRVSYISRIENGNWKRVGGQIWDKLGKALHTTATDLMHAGATETTIDDIEVVRVPIRGEGGFVYVSQKDIKEPDGRRLLALRVETNGWVDAIHPGDILILQVDAEYEDDALYEITYKGQHLVRRLHREGNSYLVYGKGPPQSLPVEDVRIEGRFIYHQPAGRAL